MTELPPEALNDPFRPPRAPVEVHCLHCNREYESYLIWWDESEGDEEVRGFWRCPTPGCTGAGFGVDIFPTDPDYRGEDGELMWCDDEYEEEEDEEDWEDIESITGDSADGSSRGDDEPDDDGIPW